MNSDCLQVLLVAVVVGLRVAGFFASITRTTFIFHSRAKLLAVMMMTHIQL